ncbi:Glycosyltransferase involved in cell wall bisynthesis [Nonlabens sp. Hel1_33_55]|uniref:glycosyltransferase family 4 protein n=1 Tax=Nonlabens sp. Hel1_33_55 TaxID=1336802 RepID=UPI000875DDA9|nr:glycosyltransferase family 4 protein [Nonlabens sp. Hel1_33_55]SCX92876.1 Glycosyltransferase involved in cell wall bisynthesis [Nonlabens sp. Hel1_33_55]
MRIHILYIGNKLASRNRTASTIDTLGPLLEQEGYQLKFASSRPSKIMRSMEMLAMVWKNKKWVDVVLIDTYSTLNFWYAIFIGRMCHFLKINYVPILHGGNLPIRLETHSRVLNHYLKNAHEVVCPNEYLYSAFAKAGYSNLHIIPNSIEIDNYPFKTRTELEPKLLWVRSFAEIYNPMMAVKVLEKIRVDYPQATLTMVGPDKDGTMKECRQYSDNQVLDVKFTGLLSKGAWVELSREADIFLNTSNFDNMPVSIIEAMALGLPVVSTNVGGMSHLIQDKLNGILVDEGNTDQMVTSIKLLVENHELAQSISLNGRKLVSKFSWSVIKKDWHKLLKT